MGTVVVTGANKGIGLEFCRQYHNAGWDVVALCRKESPALHDLGVRVVEKIDVTDETAVAKVATQLRGTTIDLLINNAGILSVDGIDSFSSQLVLQQLTVNALAPIRLAIALLPMFHAGSKIAMITSRMGSIGDNTSGGYYGYRMSKAALNAGAVSLARDLANRKIYVGIYHPGFVKTEMTSHRGEIDAATAATGIRRNIDSLDAKTSGVFFHSNGDRLEW